MKTACCLIRLQRLIHRLALAISIFVAALPAVVAAEEKATVAVGLRSGKVFVGRVDSRANEQQLWLRHRERGSSFADRSIGKIFCSCGKAIASFRARNFAPQYYRRRQLPRRCA